jgi:hypothetical protein
MKDSVDLLSNNELISDLCRYRESVLTEAQIRRKWRHLDNAVWDEPSEALVDAVEAEAIRRVRSGTAARELAQKHHVAAPNTLSSIMNDAGTSAKNRIESARELRAVAATGPEAIPPADRFQIIINLSGDDSRHSGDDILRFDKSRTPDDADPNRVMAIAAKPDDNIA